MHRLLFNRNRTSFADAGHIPQPSLGDRWVGAGGRADMLCKALQVHFLWANDEETSGRPKATRCSLAAARRGPLSHIRCAAETHRQKGNSGIAVDEGLAWS
eukprot:scaffold7597_cov132-Isochrysis_galbana.AAC.4